MLTPHPNAIKWRSGVLIPLALALVVWALYLFLAPQLVAGVNLFSEGIESWDRAERYAMILLGLALALSSLPLLKRCFRWLGRRRWWPFDTTVGVILVLGIFCLFFERLHSSESEIEPLLWFPIVVASLFSFVRVAVGIFYIKRSPIEAEGEGLSLFDQVLDEGGGLAPLQMEEEDELERAPLVDELYRLVTRPRAQSMNFGVEGAWGSGKTSLLRMLQNRLSINGFAVAVLDLWSYRQPDRMVRAFFDQIGHVLDERAPDLIPSRVLRRLATGLLELGGSRTASAMRTVFPDFANPSLDSSKARLNEVLGGLESPIIVFIDDLDRVDRDELVSILRSVNLLSHLPNLNMILAYDWTQLSAILFRDTSNDLRDDVARDHLAKVINYELPLGSPPNELLVKMVERSLDPLLNRVRDERQLEDFKRRFKEGLAHRELVKALPTPREIRRIAAATAAGWDSMAGHLNLFDLFVLTIAQYRAPTIYRKIWSSPEGFLEVKWSWEYSWLALDESALSEARDRARELLKELSYTVGGDGVARLLSFVFSNLDVYESDYIDEIEARRTRRAMHPDLIGRYFTPYVPSNIVSESEIEAYADSLKNAPAGSPRQKALIEIVRDEEANGRVDSFLEQWNLVFGKYPTSRDDDSDDRGPYPEDLVQDLALGMAKASGYFDTGYRWLLSDQSTRAAFKVLFLCTHLPAGKVDEFCVV